MLPAAAGIRMQNALLAAVGRHPKPSRMAYGPPSSLSRSSQPRCALPQESERHLRGGQHSQGRGSRPAASGISRARSSTQATSSSWRQQPIDTAEAATTENRGETRPSCPAWSGPFGLLACLPLCPTAAAWAAGCWSPRRWLFDASAGQGPDISCCRLRSFQKEKT